jgi:MFS family permease
VRLTAEPTTSIRRAAVLLVVTAAAVSANFTNYGALIPSLRTEFGVGSGQIGLMSTLLYVGIGATYLVGGVLADRVGSRRVLLVALALIGGGGVLMTLLHELWWMLLWRSAIGMGSGAAIVASGRYASQLGDLAPLGQGLFGGAMQAGAAAGLFLTPPLATLLGTWGVFQFWGTIALVAWALWITLESNPSRRAQAPRMPRAVQTAFALPQLRRVGLATLGTLGVGQAAAPWLAVYCAHSLGLPMGAAATLGGASLFIGTASRPLGGFLASRGVDAYVLMRVGAAVTTAGLLALALPWAGLTLSLLGLCLLAVGTTLPYAAALSEGARLGKEVGVGAGTGQGVVATWSAPASAFGPPLIGALYGLEGSFGLAFAAMAAITVTAVFAARRTASPAHVSSGAQGALRPMNA